MGDGTNLGRRFDDAALAVVDAWRSGVDDKLELIYEQTTKINGRVTELEKREYIRKDREEQKAILDAAAEAAKYQVQQRNDQEAAQVIVKHHTRVTWKVMVASACAGGAIDALVHLLAS